MTIQSLVTKWNMFFDTFLNKGGYKEVLTGLLNTLIIALLALVLGIIIGTIIAAIEVQPKKYGAWEGAGCSEEDIPEFM